MKIEERIEELQGKINLAFNYDSRLSYLENKITELENNRKIVYFLTTVLSILVLFICAFIILAALTQPVISSTTTTQINN